MRSIMLDRRWLDSRQLRAGLIGALLLHLLGWVMIPENVFHSDPSETANPYREYTIELSDPEEEIPEQVFTQTNPEVPENEPDETNNFSARSQQAANPDLPDEIDPDNRPTREAEREFDTEQFLTGDLEQLELAPPPPPSTEGQNTPEQPVTSQPLLTVVSESNALERKIPFVGNLEEEEEIEEEEGIVDYLNREAQESPNNLLEDLLGQAEHGDAQSEDGSEVSAQSPQLVASEQSPDGEYPSPRPRRKLPRVPAMATRSLNAGVVNTGKLAMDARASELGEYAERMIETVSTIWDSIVAKSSNPDKESKVVLQFVLTKEGMIEDLELIEEGAKTLSIYECRTAILNGQSYGEWTPSMIQAHGERKQIVFVFYYIR